jgi:hypothetical protein
MELYRSTPADVNDTRDNGKRHNYEENSGKGANQFVRACALCLLWLWLC